MTSDSQRRDIIRLRGQGVSTDEVAQQVGVTRGVVCNTWYAFNNGNRYQDLATVPRPEKILNLHDWQGIEAKPQLQEFSESLARLERDKRYILAEHDTDNHFPYHDEAAQALRSLCRQVIQPDVIVCGSDAADFPTISRFEADRRIPTGRVLSRFRTHWANHVNNHLSYDAPDALKVWIDGNHDERAWLAIESDDNYDILHDYHVNTITQDNQVYWRGVGDDSLEVKIANALIVTHGWKASRHTASAMLDEFDRQYSGMSGHSHRPDYYTTGTKYKVTWLIGGCGCELKPAYDRRKTRTKWQHGYSYGIADVATETAILKHIDFIHEANKVWCVVNGDVLSVDKRDYEGQVAA